MPAKRLSFPKSRRLTQETEFERVKQSGRLRRGTLMMLSVLDLAMPAAPAAKQAGWRPGSTAKAVSFRAGFITPRRIGGSVVRNRVRRRLREIVRRHQEEIVDGKWVVTIAHPGAARSSYAELEDEWLRLAKRASILAP
jgi:ribonuclease P protein component